ncbi:MAG: hypothetical protein LRS43_01895, partial [Desulfurococcales archaeon]|nr:hypothetical protein [Desulfurococcales archaeon]
VDVNVNVTAIFPTGTTGSVSVWVATEALSPGQITALGYPDPATAFTGRETAFLITDIRINRTITAGSPPTVEINMTVPSPDATAYFWNDTIMDWQPFPNQTVVPVGGTFVLRMQIGVELMGTPFVITIPAPPPAVGGILDLETATGKAGAAMIAIGVALLVASLVAYKRLGRERASLAATTPSPGGAEY